MLSNTASFIDRPAYFSELVKAIRASQEHDEIILATFSFKPEFAYIKDIVEALCLAAQRGVKVDFLVDAYTYLIKDGAVPGPLWFTNNSTGTQGSFAIRTAALNQLRQSGVRVTIINQPGRRLTNPFSGRCHMKYACFKHIAFVGGCNLTDHHQADLMVKLTDQKTISALRTQVYKIAKAQNAVVAFKRKDKEVIIDAYSSLLFDCGLKKQSLILDKAVKLIDEAEQEIVIASQYFLDGRILQHLLEAVRRGVTVKIVYNSPWKYPPPLNLWHWAELQASKLKYPSSFFINERPRQNAYLHAKALITDQGYIVGSNNFVSSLIRWGTGEIALYGTDSGSILAARKALEALL